MGFSDQIFPFVVDGSPPGLAVPSAGVTTPPPAGLIIAPPLARHERPGYVSSRSVPATLERPCQAAAGLPGKHGYGSQSANPQCGRLHRLPCDLFQSTRPLVVTRETSAKSISLHGLHRSVSSLQTLVPAPKFNLLKSNATLNNPTRHPNQQNPCRHSRPQLSMPPLQYLNDAADILHAGNDADSTRPVCMPCLLVFR